MPATPIQTTDRIPVPRARIWFLAKFFVRASDAASVYTGKPYPGGRPAISQRQDCVAAAPSAGRSSYPRDVAQRMRRANQLATPSSMDLMDDGENGRLAPFTYPRRASSAETSRNDRWWPFAERRRKRFASLTRSGFISTWLLRPSHLPTARFRSRAARSFETSRHFSYCANEPAIWRIGAQQDRIRDFDTDCPWGSLGGANQGSILDAD
jgi:hypothetical protein